MIYVDCRLKATQLEIPVNFQENLLLEITNAKKNINLLFGAIYRSPNSTAQNDLELNEIIKYVNKKHTGSKIPMQDIHVTREQIEAKFKSLNIDKSPGPDLLYPRILYEVRQEIAEPLKKKFWCFIESR